MAKLHIVVEKRDDWRPYYPSGTVLTAEEYLNLPLEAKESLGHVINLCRSYRYLGKGYYCSLLAEARGHRVIPTVRSINDISRKYLYSLDIDDLSSTIEHSKALRDHSTSGEFELQVFFGRTEDQQFSELGRKLYELFTIPILLVKFKKEKIWRFDSIRPGSISQLDSKGEDLFAAALDAFSNKIWRLSRTRKVYRYDLAILHDPNEALPPSNKKALKKFCDAGEELGINCELIEKNDFSHLLEYDALFIRETTAINHHTYKFAKKAESEGLIVIDDPHSILKCTNKVYLSRLLDSHRILTPKSWIIDRDQPHTINEAIQNLGFPMVVKIPDGSFSVGIVKVENADEFTNTCRELFKKSVLLLVQEFLYTDFDWRIGILNQRPLYACRYYMSKGHWQIYNHNSTAKINFGKTDNLPIARVPEKVVRVATKAANLIGHGLYGVDLKQRDDHVYVIEVNDNPSIEAGTEDTYLGDDLYARIMEEFLRRLQRRSG